MTLCPSTSRSPRIAAVTAESLTGAPRLCYASVPRLGRRMPMKRRDDSQRSDGLPVTFAHPGDPHESLTARRAYASVPRLGFDGWS